MPLGRHGDLPNPGIKPTSRKSPALAGGFFTTSASWEAPKSVEQLTIINLEEGFAGGSAGKESACNAGDPGSIPGSEDPLEK